MYPEIISTIFSIMTERKRLFEEYCWGTFVDGKTTHAVVTAAYVSLVISVLQNPAKEEELLADMDKARKAKFKYKIKAKKYSWMTIPDIGNGIQETVLTVPKKNGNGHLIVVPVEKFFQTLDCLHESTGHARLFTMWNKVVSTYTGLPRSAVKKFLEGCLSCQCRASQTNQATPKPIVADDVFSRVQANVNETLSESYLEWFHWTNKIQVDLIDMISRPSGDYRYILHVMDHFSKFHLLHALKQKTAEEVNSALTAIFGIIGLPTILQTDNGSEFNQLSKIFENWPGAASVKIIHGRPAHPQSQGLVERGHRLVQDRLAIYEAESKKESGEPFLWHQKLPLIQYQINTAFTSTTKDMPYRIIFGREPKSLPLFGQEVTITEETESGDSFSTAYDDCSDHEIEIISEGITVTSDCFTSSTDQTSQAEKSPTTDINSESITVECFTSSSDQTPNASSPAERPQTNDTCTEVNTEYIPSSTEETQTEPPQTNDTDHQKIRMTALENLKKFREKRTIRKPRRFHQPIHVGSFVTLAIPAEYRHKCDLRRLPGIVVKIRDKQQPSYMIRTEYCLVDGWFRADTVQLFDGVLPLVVEGWEDLQSLPLRTAAAIHRQHNTVTTRCGCKGKCTTMSCRCHKHGNVCTSSCHGGRPCSNRETVQEPNRSDQPVDVIREYTSPIITSLQQTVS